MGHGIEHAANNERKWDSRAATYDQKRFDYFRLMQKMVIGQIDLKPGICFLDIGCGTGWAVRYVAGLLGGKGEFWGVDISGKMIETAQSQSRGFSHVHFHKADVERLPLDSNSIDCAICTNSFHHYLDPLKALAEIRRVLAVGGRIYVMDVTTDDFFLRFIDGQVRKMEPEHVKFYSSKEYQSMFAEAQLTCLSHRLLTYPLKVHVAEKQE